jgi:membrane protein implicated in regulation of membrane protease activity
MDIWILIGILLLALEIFTTSFFLLFFGLAALVVALLLLFFSIPLSIQILIFTALSALFFFVGKKIIKTIKKSDDEVPDTIINQVGQTLTCSNENGYLKVMIGDTIWNAKSNTFLKKGQQVRVVALNNLTAEVEPL